MSTTRPTNVPNPTPGAPGIPAPLVRPGDLLESPGIPGEFLVKGVTAPYRPSGDGDPGTVIGVVVSDSDQGTVLWEVGADDVVPTVGGAEGVFLRRLERVLGQEGCLAAGMVPSEVAEVLPVPVRHPEGEVLQESFVRACRIALRHEVVRRKQAERGVYVPKPVVVFDQSRQAYLAAVDSGGTVYPVVAVFSGEGVVGVE